MNNKIKAGLLGTVLAGSGFLAGAMTDNETPLAGEVVETPEVAVEDVNIAPKVEVTDDVTKPKEEAKVRVTEYEIVPKVTEITQSAVERGLTTSVAKKALLEAEISQARAKIENASNERELEELQGYLRNLQNAFDLTVSTEAFYRKQKAIVDEQVAKLPAREEKKVEELTVPTLDIIENIVE